MESTLEFPSATYDSPYKRISKFKKLTELVIEIGSDLETYEHITGREQKRSDWRRRTHPVMTDEGFKRTNGKPV